MRETERERESAYNKIRKDVLEIEHIISSLFLSLPTAGATAVTVPLAAKSVPEEGTEGKENPPNAPRLGVLAGTDTAGVLTGRLNPAKPPIVDKIV